MVGRSTKNSFGTAIGVPKANRELQIDASESVDNKVWVGNILVPVVYLKNGKILVPAQRYY